MGVASFMTEFSLKFRTAGCDVSPSFEFNLKKRSNREAQVSRCACVQVVMTKLLGRLSPIRFVRGVL